MRPIYGEPMVSPDSLLYLLSEISHEKREQIQKRLGVQPREQLVKTFRHYLWGGQRKQAWIIAEEFSRRGIPPAFRPSPFLDGKPRIPKEDVFLHDLQWLAFRYPAHRVFMTRYQTLFDPEQFVRTAKFLLWRGLHKPHFYIKALALTDEQQAECVYLPGADMRRRMQTVENLSTVVFEALQLANRSNPRARAQQETDWRATVQRRHDIWRCGSMADWLPTRTAELYKALTGIEISKALAGKIIEEVHRDYPASKPPATRRRRRKAMKPVRTPTTGWLKRVRRGKPRKAKAAL